MDHQANIFLTVEQNKERIGPLRVGQWIKQACPLSVASLHFNEFNFFLLHSPLSLSALRTQTTLLEGTKAMVRITISGFWTCQSLSIWLLPFVSFLEQCSWQTADELTIEAMAGEEQGERDFCVAEGLTWEPKRKEFYPYLLSVIVSDNMRNHLSVAWLVVCNYLSLSLDFHHQAFRLGNVEWGRWSCFHYAVLTLAIESKVLEWIMRCVCFLGWYVWEYMICHIYRCDIFILKE